MNTFTKSYEIERVPLIKQNEEHNYTSQSQSKYHKESRFDVVFGVISEKSMLFHILNEQN